MSHIDEGTIHAWLDGQLTPHEATRVERHVRDCRPCADAVAEARGLVAASSRILGALDDVPADVIPPASRSAPAPRRLWRAAPWVTGIAAVLMAAVVLRTSELAREGAPARDMMATAPTAVAPDTFDSAARAAADTLGAREELQANLAERTVAAAPPSVAQRAAAGRARPLPRVGAIAGGAATAEAAGAPPSPPPAAPVEASVTAPVAAFDMAAKSAETQDPMVRCYTVATTIAPPTPTPVRQLGDQSVRRERAAAVASAAAPERAIVTHRQVRLEPTPQDSGFLARDVRADSIIGTWKRVAPDSAQLTLKNGLRIPLARTAGTECP